MFQNILPPFLGIFSSSGGSVPTSGLSIWLESDLGLVYDGSNNIGTWTDQSGNGNNAVQNASSSKPLYTASDSALNNLPSATFNGGSDDFLYIPYSSTTMNGNTNGFTCYIVAYPTAWFSTFSFLFGGTNGTSWTQGWFIYVYSGSIRFNINNWNSTTSRIDLATPLTNQLTLFKFKWDKTTMEAFYRQGGVTTSGTKAFSGTMSVPLASWEICRGGSTIYDMSGKLGEILYYNTPLNAIEELNLETYLKNKYGIA